VLKTVIVSPRTSPAFELAGSLPDNVVSCIDPVEFASILQFAPDNLRSIKSLKAVFTEQGIAFPIRETSYRLVALSDPATPTG